MLVQKYIYSHFISGWMAGENLALESRMKSQLLVGPFRHQAHSLWTGPVSPPESILDLAPLTFGRDHLGHVPPGTRVIWDLDPLGLGAISDLDNLGPGPFWSQDHFGVRS